MNAWPEFLQHSLMLRLGWALLHFLWQGAILGAVAGLLSVAMRNGLPQVRYLTLLFLLGMTIICPFATFLLLGESENPVAIAERAVAQFPAPTQEPTPHLARAEPRVPASRAVPDATLRDIISSDIHTGSISQLPRSRFAGLVLPWLVIGWCGGVSIFTVRMIGGWCKMRTLVTRRVQPVSDAWQEAICRLTAAVQIRRQIRWLESAVVNVPLTVGWLRPVVVLPTSVLTGLPRAEVECLLAHELAHIRRHDYLVNLLQCVIEVLLFYHPAVWWISRRVRQEREQTCDEIAVCVTGDRMAYSRALLSVADLASRPSVLAIAANGGLLKERVQRVLGIPTTPVATPIGAVLACIGMVLGSTACLLAVPNSEQHVGGENATGTADPQRVNVETFSDGQFQLLPIAGRVVGPAGQPVAGASVSLREAAGGFLSSVSPTKLSPTKGLDLARMATDAQGRFRFTDVPADDDNPRIDVVVVAEGHALAWRHLPGGIPQENVRVVLEPEVQLSGRVVDESGDPVSEATIWLRHTMSIRHITQADLDEGRWPRSDDEQYLKLTGFRVPPSARTDADGRFTLTGLPPGLGLVLQVAHPRHVLADVFAATVEGIDAENAAKAKRTVQVGQVHVTLAPARVLDVRVVYEDTGAPVIGARYPNLSNGIVRPPTLEADSTGRFRITHLTRHNVALFVYPPTGSDYLPQIEYITFPEDVYEKRHTVKLKRGAIVMGRVVDEETGEGIGAVPLQVTPRVISPEHAHHIPPINDFETRSDGTFRIATIPGEVKIAVNGRVPGYSSSHGNGSVSDSDLVQQQITASMDAAVEGVVIQLQSAPIVSGTVYGPDGEPAADVSIGGQALLGSEESGIAYRSLQKRTDKQGWFSLDGVHAAWQPSLAPQSVEVIFRDRLRNLGQLVSIDPPTDRDARERNIEVHLQPLGVVTGRFINSDSRQPVPDVRVSLYKRRADLDQRSWHAVSPELRSDRDGRFELAGVFEGAMHYLNVVDGRFRRVNGLETQFEGRFGVRHDLGDVELVPVELPAAQQLPLAEAPSIGGMTEDRAVELLLKQYAADYAAYRKTLKGAAVGRERDHVAARRDPTPAYARALHGIAETHRNSDVELRSLIWIVNCQLTTASMKELRPLKVAAAQRLLDAYIGREELAACVNALLVYPQSELSSLDQAVATAERLLQENPHREVLAHTCYQVAQRIAFDHIRSPFPSEREQAIGYLDRVVDEFSDIPHGRRGTLGDAAKRDLFELSRLVAGARAPQITGTDVDGRAMSLSDFRGRIVVLEFWDSWCGPCILELPALNTISEEFDDSVAVLGVMSDKPAEAKQAVDEHDVKFRNWVDGESSKGPIVNQWNIDTWPTVYVLDQQGIIRHKDLHGTQLRDAVWKLLQQ